MDETKTKIQVLLTPALRQERLNFIQKSLAEIAKSHFWRIHFSNKKFVLDFEKISWNDWCMIPFFSKEEFLKIGFRFKLTGIHQIAGDSFCFVLKSTSGTTNATKPILLLNKAQVPSKNIYERRATNTVWLQASFSTALEGVILNILDKMNSKKNFKLLIIFPQILDKSVSSLESFSQITIFTTPHIFTFFIEQFKKINSLRKISLFGDFLTDAELHLLKLFFPKCGIKITYGLEEFGEAVAHDCSFLRRKYGINSYHPYTKRSYQLIEIADMNEVGVGEIILTRLKPKSMALIRYRTGDMGRAIEEKCECGADFTLILEGRKDYDFIKLAGALLTRAELERVIGKFANEIKDWRAEIGEKLMPENTLINELKIKIKPNLQAKILPPKNLSSISSYISDNLFMTPSKTFSDLVREGRFLPLKIEAVDNFPLTAKILKITRSNT